MGGNGSASVGPGGGMMPTDTMTRDSVIKRLKHEATGGYAIDGQPIEQHIPWSREHDLPAFWRQCGYTRGVEIGVEKGAYSKHLLSMMQGLHLISIDPWLAYKGYREHVTQDKLEGFYSETKSKLAVFGHRSHIMRAFSDEAAGELKDESLDFVYIDGNHTLPFVIADLHSWVRKVRSGGMVCGHDFGRGKVGHVKEAVLVWAECYKVQPVFLFTKDRSWSWGFVK